MDGVRRRNSTWQDERSDVLRRLYQTVEVVKRDEMSPKRRAATAAVTISRQRKDSHKTQGNIVQGLARYSLESKQKSSSKRSKVG